MLSWIRGKNHKVDDVRNNASAAVHPSPDEANAKDSNVDTQILKKDPAIDKPRDTVLSLTDSDTDSSHAGSSVAPAPKKTMPEVDALDRFLDYLQFIKQRPASSPEDERRFTQYEETIKSMVRIGEKFNVLYLPNKNNPAEVHFYRQDIKDYDKAIHAKRHEFSPERYPYIFGEKTALFTLLYLEHLKRFEYKSSKNNSAFIDERRSKEIQRAKTLRQELLKYYNDHSFISAHRENIEFVYKQIYEYLRLQDAFYTFDNESQKNDLLYRVYLATNQVHEEYSPQSKEKATAPSCESLSEEELEAFAENILIKECPAEHAFIRSHMRRLRRILEEKNINDTVEKMLSESNNEEEESSNDINNTLPQTVTEVQEKITVSITHKAGLWSRSSSPALSDNEIEDPVLYRALYG